jgi:hypothetical protein
MSGAPLRGRALLGAEATRRHNPDGGQKGLKAADVFGPFERDLEAARAAAA